MPKRYIILILILVVVLTGSFADAQIRSTDIVLSISPQYPSADQKVTATLNSHSVNLDKANIAWSLDDQELNRGIGRKSFSFKMGEIGVSTILSVIVETIDGQSISKTMTITSTNVDMLWEAYDSYSPPFYRGKTLVSSQGEFKVVAMPNLMNQNGKTSVNNLSYVWTEDGTVQSNSSGWGKNYFIFQNSYLDKENIVRVKVSDISGGTNASGELNLKTVNPKIIFYKNDPSLGTNWGTALSNGFTLNQSGETIVVEPYFFSPKNIKSSDLSLNWFLNGERIETPELKNVLSVKPQDGQTGNATIKVVINNVNTLFQSLEKQLNISF